ncbi:MAG: isopentenyl-diphosphate delta-isomerase [Saprospiraceae bacterium]|jgi:isopentenyl-diphosphate delta-isomerase
MDHDLLDRRFYYEPILNGHPTEATDISIDLLGRKFQTPIWVSSMTGGTELAKSINTNLAKACGEYGMGMGLGSCRSLLESDDRIHDFDMRTMLNDQPLYSNLGIAQIGELFASGKETLILELVKKLQADGLIIHVNPLQEWLQPEGDIYYESPLDLIKRVIDLDNNLKIIVKEVGQGMGPKSLRALYELPIQAIDFAAGGGTNFSKLELQRASEEQKEKYAGLAKVGHSALEMVEMVNGLRNLHGDNFLCSDTIISGGVSDYLDGYYLTQKLNGAAIYGQASGFLKHAMGTYESLQQHIESQIRGLQMAHQFLSIR